MGTNMLMGWATGYFGLFHIKKDEEKTPSLNLVGVSLAVLSLLFFTQARDVEDEQDSTREEAAGSADLELAVENGIPSDDDDDESVDSDSNEITVESPLKRESRTFVKALMVRKLSRSDSMASLQFNLDVPGQFRWMSGFAMAMAAGLFMGYAFTPAIQLSQLAGNGTDQMDYVWSSFAGIFLSGNVAFVCYVLVRGEKSYIPRAAVLPAITSGAIWAVAQVAWFKANQELTMSIAFPIIASLPGIVALSIGVFFFGELQTKRARLFAFAGVGVRLPAIFLIALSNLV